MRYSLIYADPPWQYRDKAQAGNRGACFKYPVMSFADIMQLDVASLAADDCLLAMWWVPPQPAEALAVVEAWGFTIKTMCGFTWHKITKNGKDHFGMGHWTRANAENVLFAVRGKPKRDCAGTTTANWLYLTRVANATQIQKTLVLAGKRLLYLWSLSS